MSRQVLRDYKEESGIKIAHTVSASRRVPSLAFGPTANGLTGLKLRLPILSIPDKDPLTRIVSRPFGSPASIRNSFYRIFWAPLPELGVTAASKDPGRIFVLPVRNDGEWLHLHREGKRHIKKIL